MKRYGLIGERLGHSYSKTLHGLLQTYAYELLPMPPQELDAFMTARAFDGINVTIPYKQAVIPYCAELSACARRIGSVNTVVKRADGSLYGDNTDAYGFAMLARGAGMDFHGVKALVLGSGGTSLTACDVVRRAGGEAVVISRNGENRYEELERHADAAFLINATPVGMYPNTDAAAVDLVRLPNLRGVLDVIYNPLRTRLLQQAEALGIPCACGLSMLAWQAARACEQFTGTPVPPERVRGALRELRKAAMNLVLVGMPGCGKSTVGAEAARLMDLPLVDLDAEIEREAGMDIPSIFAKWGEGGFRTLEAALVERFGREGGRVLVTGGGAVSTAANREHLRLNGFVIHLTRDISLLPMAGRPLSQSREALERLWRERAPLYAACADGTIENQNTPAACARAVVEAYHEALCNQWP
ncbi:MAG: shikimate kinase [Clostridia bacterium]